jgi:hypothetical protein
MRSPCYFKQNAHQFLRISTVTECELSVTDPNHILTGENWVCTIKTLQFFRSLPLLWSLRQRWRGGCEFSVSDGGAGVSKARTRRTVGEAGLQGRARCCRGGRASGTSKDRILGTARRSYRGRGCHRPLGLGFQAAGWGPSLHAYRS